MEAYTSQEEMLKLCLMDYMEGIPVDGLICVHTEDHKILGLDGLSEIVYTGLQVEIVESELDKSGKVTGYKEVLVHQTKYLEEVVSAFRELFKGGRDFPLDPESFKGQPTETKDTKTGWGLRLSLSLTNLLRIATLALPLAVLGVKLGFWFNGAAPPTITWRSFRQSLTA
eukprot:840652-Amphidinium_carterae.1